MSATRGGGKIIIHGFILDGDGSFQDKADKGAELWGQARFHGVTLPPSGAQEHAGCCCWLIVQPQQAL